MRAITQVAKNTIRAAHDSRIKGCKGGLGSDSAIAMREPKAICVAPLRATYTPTKPSALHPARTPWSLRKIALMRNSACSMRLLCSFHSVFAGQRRIVSRLRYTYDRGRSILPHGVNVRFQVTNSDPSLTAAVAETGGPSLPKAVTQSRRSRASSVRSSFNLHTLASGSPVIPRLLCPFPLKFDDLVDKGESRQGFESPAPPALQSNYPSAMRPRDFCVSWRCSVVLRVLWGLGP